MNIITAIAQQVTRATARNGAHKYGTKTLSTERFFQAVHEISDVKDINGYSADGIVSTNLDDLALELYIYQCFQLALKNETKLLSKQLKSKFVHMVNSGEMVSGDLFNVTLQTENHNPVLEPGLLRVALQNYLEPALIEEIIVKSSKDAIPQEKIHITPVDAQVAQSLEMAITILLNHTKLPPIEELLEQFTD